MSKNSEKSAPKNTGKKTAKPSVSVNRDSDYLAHDCPIVQSFLHESIDPIYIITPDDKIVFMNRALEDLLNIRSGEVKTYLQLMRHRYPDKKERDKAIAEFRKDLTKKKPERRLRKVLSSDDTVRWFYCKIVKLADGNIMVSSQDVTEIKEAEYALESSQFALENTSDAVFCIRQDAKFIYTNKQASKSLGYTKKELLGMSVPDVDPLFPMAEWSKLWKEICAKKNITIESVHQKKNGDTFPVEILASYAVLHGEEYIFAYARDIGNRKKRADALLKAQFALDNASDAIAWIDSEGRFTYVNNMMCKCLGYTRKELLELHVYDVDTYVTRKSWSSLWGDLKENGSGVKDTMYKGKHGATIPVGISGTYTVFGEEEFVFAHIRDISERKRSDLALLESERSFKQLSDLAFEAVFIHDQGRLINANKRFYDLFGYSRKELEGKDIVKLTVAASHYTDVIERWASGGTDIYETVSRRKDGSDFPVEVRVHDMDYDGKKVRAVAVMDISYRRQVEESLQASEHKFRQIIESSPIGMFMYQLMDDGSLVLTGANPAADKLTNYDNSKRVGMTIEEAFPALAGTEVPKRYKAAAKKGKTWYSEQIDYEDDKINGAFEVYAFQAGPNMMVAAFWNITARKESEAELRRLAAAVESAAESIVVTDSKGDITYVNPWFETMTGYSRKEAIGQHVGMLASKKHDAEFYAELWKTISSGKTWRGHFLNMKKDGTIFEEDAVISPVKNASGEIVNYVAVKRDVTQEVLLENQIMQSQKMAAIGQLAHKIAHNFTNVLVVILGNAQLAKDTVTQNSETSIFLDEVINAANRVSTLTAELLAFAHPTEPRLRPMKLSKALMGVEDLLRETVAPRIELVVDLSEADYKVNLDSVMLEQVLVHLAINSEEAMKKHGGTLTIKAGLSDYGEGFGMLVVSDTGDGLTEDVKKQIFDPFFSTKSASKNAGLGLATVYSIVSQHKGFISVESEPGQGAEFKIYLPIVG